MAFLPHRYDEPRLPDWLTEAYTVLGKLNNLLYQIQEATGIPGMHADCNSDDQTAGVLERLQDMWDASLEDDSAETLLAAFRAFDADGHVLVGYQWEDLPEGYRVDVGTRAAGDGDADPEWVATVWLGKDGNRRVLTSTHDPRWPHPQLLTLATDYVDREQRKD